MLSWKKKNPSDWTSWMLVISAKPYEFLLGLRKNMRTGVVMEDKALPTGEFQMLFMSDKLYHFLLVLQKHTSSVLVLMGQHTSSWTIPGVLHVSKSVQIFDGCEKAHEFRVVLIVYDILTIGQIRMLLMSTKLYQFLLRVQRAWGLVLSWWKTALFRLGNSGCFSCHPRDTNFFCVCKVTYGLVLSRWKTTPFQLANTGCFSCQPSCTNLYCWACKKISDGNFRFL